MSIKIYSLLLKVSKPQREYSSLGKPTALNIIHLIFDRWTYSALDTASTHPYYNWVYHFVALHCHKSKEWLFVCLHVCVYMGGSFTKYLSRIDRWLPWPGKNTHTVYYVAKGVCLLFCGILNENICAVFGGKSCSHVKKSIKCFVKRVLTLPLWAIHAWGNLCGLCRKKSNMS